MNEPKRLLIDFDNTLTQDDVEYWAGERSVPDENVCEATRKHYYSGGTVIVWTARPWSEASAIAARMTEWEVPFHGIRCEKGSGDLYVDDKSISPEEFASN